MNLSAPFIRRPVATSLLTMGIILAGLTAYFQLPVSPLPKLDAPAIAVSVTLPGASPEVVATSATTPLERHLGVIADVDQMTSVSTTSRGSIVLVFELSRDIDGAARDVQAAVVAARADLPTNLRSYPTYRKMNPNDAPILSLAMTSKTKTPAQIYDQADSILGQRLSQLPGVGQVGISGSSLPAVRVELNPDALYHYGIGLEDVRAAIGNANAHGPQGSIEAGDLHYQVRVNDQATLASQYVNLIIAYRNGRAVRLKDVSDIQDGVEDLRNAGYANGERAVSLQITRQPAANIIETVDRIVALLPELRASIPNDINLFVTWDRSASIRASLRDVQRTLLIAICLVTFVVFLFLRDFRSALIPTIAVPVSLIGTFSIMYLLDFSLNNLSLMALTVATGFVVDDAIVVLENVSRHLEAGLPRFKAALLGAQEVGFTVVSMSLSLTAVFIPLLLMGGFLGRLFWEFSMTLTVSVLISMVISLTLTPVMCAYILRPHDDRKPHRLMVHLERGFERLKESYRGSLVFALDHRGLTMAALILTIVLNLFLFGKVPKGFFPQQDTGRLFASVVADQSTSFQSMQAKLEAYLKILRDDSAVAQVSGAVGAGGYGSTGSNSARFLIALKPRAERPDGVTTDQVMARLRPRLARVKGSQVFLQIAQEFGRGGRQSNALYQYTLQADNVQDLSQWVPRLVEELQKAPELTDVNSDQQNHGLESDLVIDRQSAGRLGIQTVQIDNTLYDAFGQRQVSTIFNPLNQYHVVMEVAPKYWQSPEMLKEVYVSTAGGAVNGSASTNVVVGPTAQSQTNSASGAAPSAAAQIRNQQANSVGATGRSSGSTASAVATASENMIPLSAIASFQPGTTPVSINHQGLFVATTISFNIAQGKSLSDADRIIHSAMNQIGMPASVHGSFQGAAQGFTQSMAQIPLLFLAAVAAIYIILGMLYESYIHPITILSTLPSAGVGAFVALILLNGELNLIADIGVVLLIGIVKKNAIMMIDFAIVAERQDGLQPRQAIEQACMLRFRPIMMTTMAALFGALPLAIGFGEGSEMRQPLGISIVGGLILSQVLTLYTTPVVYLLLDRLRGHGERRDPRLLLNIAHLQPGQS